MRIVVLGGTGFIGPDVVRLLVERGDEVTIVHRGEREAALPVEVRHVHVARSDLPGLRDEIERLGPDVVIDMHAMNVVDARSTVLTFAGIAGRAVVVSSSDVYRAYGRIRDIEPGPPDPIPLREDSPLRSQLYPDRGAPKHDRAEEIEHYDKILVERAVRSARDLPATILRLGFVHGPRSYRHYPYVRRVLDGRPAVLLEERFAAWRGTFAYSENVAAAIALAATHPAAQGRVYNVGEGDGLTVRALVEAIGEAAGWPGRVVTVAAEDLPEELRPRLALDQHFVLDSTRIRSELGYRETVALGEGLRRTIEWMRTNPPAPEEPMAQIALDYDAEDHLLRSLAGA